MTATNPFRYGALALDDAFTDREAEVAELRSDALNGQDVVLFAPRRYGKTSLMWRVSQALISEGALVAQVNLMTTPTVARLADKLARAIHDDIASPLFRAKERLRIFQGLRITPIITVDPEDGSLSFSFDGARRPADLNATLERLLELPGVLAGERKRQVVLIFDEFQEIVDIEANLPKLMRSVFQEQPEVSHIYLGSKRHMMERIFNDENEPFWRSAKQYQLGVIDPEIFGGYILSQFQRTGREISGAALEVVLEVTHGHPYATQELCYFLWQRVAEGVTAGPADVADALDGVLDSEHAHFSLIWENASAHQRLLLVALARESGHPFSGEYRRRHALPAVSSVQRALIGLQKGELIARDGGRAWISEPFLEQWITRGQAS